MTTANKITLVRIAMIPFFVVFAILGGPKYDAIALVLFCLASFTDFLDGYIARKYNQVTDFGKFVDPLADKLLVTAALVIFVERGLFAAWMVFVILAREFIITSLRNVAAAKGQVMAAAWSGKVKTCVQIAGIILIFLYVIALGGMVGCPNYANPEGAIAVVALGTGWLGNLSDGEMLMLLPTIVSWVVTLVTIYSGYDYLHRNWALVAEGATRPKA
ncbi:CDP-diacylglycerol--glycerol-3-phosphate 3-phosphatidyltransferase [Butyricicoccus pullicaecorum]|uniref:CDP-diacylglycerol--glycerol-3-phosphate 3-phosphatidyltransferase n=1 Tax=Butyricicoccus pullicaecorum TaxID=501571 RepID=UPI003521AE67